MWHNEDFLFTDGGCRGKKDFWNLGKCDAAATNLGRDVLYVPVRFNGKCFTWVSSLRNDKPCMLGRTYLIVDCSVLVLQSHSLIHSDALHFRFFLTTISYLSLFVTLFPICDALESVDLSILNSF